MNLLIWEDSSGTGAEGKGRSSEGDINIFINKESTADALSRTTIPVFFLHGNNDTEVPLSHTKENFLACASDKYFSIVEGAPHTLCHYIGKENVENKINEFIIKHQS